MDLDRLVYLSCIIKVITFNAWRFFTGSKVIREAVMVENSIPFTSEGLSELTAELKQLKEVERPQVIADIAEARAHGDLSENAEYHAAREKQGFIEARIKELESGLSRASVVDVAVQDANIVRFGAYVTFSNEESGEIKTLRIVGDLEANLEKNRISLSSPLARAFLGKEVGDLVEVKVPKGIQEYVITEINY